MATDENTATGISLPEDLTTLSKDELTELEGQIREAFTKINDQDDISAEDIATMTALADQVDAVTGQRDAIVAEETERAEAREALAQRMKAPEAEAEADADADAEAAEPDADAVAEPEAEVEAETEVATVTDLPTVEEAGAEAPEADADATNQPEAIAAASTSNTTQKGNTVAKTTAARPVTVDASATAVPETEIGAIAITAAADVPGFSTGSTMASLAQVTEGLIQRASAFQAPAELGRFVQDDGSVVIPDSFTGKTEQLQNYGLANIKVNYPEELRIGRNSDAMAVLEHANNERRLAGNSLVAAGGWCSPSVTSYALCTGETMDGLLDLPEVAIERGGLRFTKGPQFRDFFNDADLDFLMTEATAIAGTFTKPCNEVTCPEWEDVRLDAVGLCVKVPILTNSSFPELITRWVQGTMTAHAHKMSVREIATIVAAVPAANKTTVVSQGSTTSDFFAGLEFAIDKAREQNAWGIDQTVEVLVPIWLRAAIRKDLELRTGRMGEAVANAIIDAWFSSRNAAPQWLRHYQAIAANATDYPTTVKAIFYRAGTFTRGVSDVISLSNVYDAASLASNTYTGIFQERGHKLLNTCYDAYEITADICNAGRSGAANITCAAPAAP